MSITTLKTTIKLRKDTEANYNLIAASFIPVNGEICLVDTVNYGLRAKVGDGVRTFAALDYEDTKNNVVLTGYFLNNKFYTDSTYQTELEKGQKHIYLDQNANNAMYVYTGSSFEKVAPNATETVAGLVKLYQSGGLNIDGTMTQKAVTEGVRSIKFATDAEDQECLVLDLPWNNI